MARWAIGLRSKGLTDKKIEQDFNQGKILRTHLLRPTWHFVAPVDIRWMLALTAPRVNQANAYMYRQSNLDASTFKRSNIIIAKALEGGKHLLREELQTELARNKIVADGFRLAYIMMRAELDQIICSGPKRGNQFTYALLDDWVPPQKGLSHEEALVELTTRFFTSRGPATIQDFSYWSGLTVAQTTKGIKLVGETLKSKTIDRQVYYYSKNKKAAKEMQTTFLMPDYDEYGMSYKDKSALSDPRFEGKLDYNRALIVEGVLAGSWKRSLVGNKILLEIKENIPLTKSQRTSVMKAARRYASFLEKELEVVH